MKDAIKLRNQIWLTLVLLLGLVSWNAYKFIINDLVIAFIMAPINIFSVTVTIRNLKKAIALVSKWRRYENGDLEHEMTKRQIHARLDRDTGSQELFDESCIYHDDAFEGLSEDD